MVEVLRTQDIPALSSTPYLDPDDWLARDADVERPIYLVVSPDPNGAGHAQSRWGLAWPLAGGAWRHVQLEAAYDPLAEFDAPYAYFGAITKSAGPEIAAARGFALGTTRLAQRRAIERLARETPVGAAGEDGRSCHRNWIRALLARIATEGIVASRTCEEAVAKACRGE